MGWLRRRAALVVLLLLLVCGDHQAVCNPAQRFRFTRVSDSETGLRLEEVSCPVLNNRGQLAFWGKRGTVEGIFLRTASATLPLFLLDVGEVSEDAAILGAPVLNDLGEVAFMQDLQSAEYALWRARPGRRQMIARTGTGQFLFFGGGPSINNLGDVAFQAELPNFEQGLFIHDGRRIHVRYVGATSPTTGTLDIPSLNNRRHVAVYDYKDEGPEPAVWIHHNGRLVLIADTSGPIESLGSPDLNDAGAVTFQGINDAGQAAIFVAGNGQLRQLAQTGTKFVFLQDPGINDRGQVAFVAAFGDEVETYNRGLFVTRGAALVEVLRTGAPLDGSVVNGIGFCRDGLNNRGQLAFWATLADGRVGIYVASPR